MSDMVERTLTALPGLFLQNQLGGPAASRAPFFSRLGGLIRGVTALSSKHVRGGVGRARWGGAVGPETSVGWMDAVGGSPRAWVCCLHRPQGGWLSDLEARRPSVCFLSVKPI